MIVTFVVLLLRIVPHAAFGQEGKVVSETSIIPGVRGDACWHDKQRVFPGAVVPWDTTGKVVRAGSGVDVCGAWPACGTCVRMYEGDCRYVYPTFVLAYNAHDSYGLEQICACKVGSCYLPWNSTEWDRNCVQELGCFSKVAPDEVGPFCRALVKDKARGAKPMKIRFVPMEFAKQSFSRPGIVAVIETEEVIDGTVRKKISEHVIHPDGKKPDPEPEGQATAYIAVVDDETATTTDDNNPRYRYQYNSGELIDYDEHSYSFSHDGMQHYVKVHKTHDSVCVKYYGSDNEQQRELINECVPMPEHVTAAPMMYSAVIVYPFAQQELRYRVHKKFNAVALELAKMLELYPSGSLCRFVKFSVFRNQKERYIVITSENRGDKFAVQRMDKVDDRIALGKPEIKSRAEYQKWKGEFNKNGKNNVAPRTALTEETFVFCYGTVECAIWGNKELCEQRSPFSADYISDYYDIPRGMFPGYLLDAKKGTGLPKVSRGYAGAKSGSYAQMITVEGTRKLRESCGADVERCRYSPVDASNVFCLLGGTEADAAEYEVRSKNDEGIARVWVKRHHKMLRRYALVNENGQTRRVACDDKYSVNLYSLSQTILSNSTVHDGQFIFPEGFSKQDAIMGSTDPCTDPKSKIAYYYESGTFASAASGSARCSHPIVQYYAPKKKIRGCAYEYVSMDDYRPLTFSNDMMIWVQDHQAEVVLRPLDPYERGFCIDNFPRLWYEPEYLWYEDGQKDPQVITEFVILRFKAASDAKLQGCQFFKIEAWGGGEAAMETETKERRSGRPGQYMMAILRNPTCKDKCNVFTTETVGGKKVEDLELFFKARIGEGGKYDAPKKASNNNNTLLGAGGDTVVEFCVYDGGEDGKTQRNEERCYEIMRAAGGGSEDIGKVWTDNIGDLMKSYRTITGDVLASDNGAQKLLLEGRAMFTKFPLEINLPLVPNMYVDYAGGSNTINVRKQHKVLHSKTAQILQYLEGRSMPREFCKRKDRYYTYRGAGEFFIPGMGGCWGADADVIPGLGESGAVVITCEQWGHTKPTFGAPKPRRKPLETNAALAWREKSVQEQQELHRSRRSR
ncbi:MAG: hypothetical protein ACTJLK_00010 [Anaplasma sp.]